MRKSTIFALLFAVMPCMAQVTGGHETVQDAIRFERHKDAAAARQARIERQQGGNATAERSAERPRSAKKPKAKSGSATRTETPK
jgi:hypothetical protein